MHNQYGFYKVVGAGLAMMALCSTNPALAGYHSTIVTVTAYSGVPSETDGHPKTAAWNNRLRRGDVAVSPDLVTRGLDDGARIAIEGFKRQFVVRDKTADDVHDTVDIYMGKATEKAKHFGQKRLRIWWHTPDD